MRISYLFILLTWVLTSCLVDEDYSLSKNDTLTFSVDSVDFDTLIAGELAHTRTFQVYNTGKSALRITSVSLLKGSNSIFRANVDGAVLADGSATDFEIRSGDSLRVFVNALPPRPTPTLPLSIRTNSSFN